MNIAAMHLALDLEVDKTSALEIPAFEDEEKDFWLNNAIRKFAKTRYSGMNIKKESFEETQKRIDDLRTLVDDYTDNSLTSGAYPNSYLASLPSDYWFALQEEATIVVSGVSKRVNIVECTTDEYRYKIDDPYSEHRLHYSSANPLRLFKNTNVELVHDGNYTIASYHLTYLKEPAEVDLDTSTDCDLPEHTHDEIVKLAASMMLENIEQPRYQTYQNEVNTIE